jgi:hypothetical protein
LLNRLPETKGRNPIAELHLLFAVGQSLQAGADPRQWTRCQRDRGTLPVLPAPKPTRKLGDTHTHPSCPCSPARNPPAAGC